MNPFDYLGLTVRDEITGLTGICNSIMEYHTGTIQCCVQPKGDGEKIPEAYYIDPDTLVLVTDGPTVNVVEPLITDNFIGKKIKDRITGSEGIATHRMTYINGCIRYSIKYLSKKDNEPSILTVEALDAILVDDGVRPKEEAKPTRTGGPAMKANRY